MPTKQNPGVFDCYKAALPDEPMFAILGRDLAGPATLGYWAQQRIALGKIETQDDRDRIKAAIEESDEMRNWRERMLEHAVDGVAPWRLPRPFVNDDMNPVFSGPPQTYSFDGCTRNYTLDEIREILMEHEAAPAEPMAEVIVQGVVRVGGQDYSIEHLERILAGTSLPKGLHNPDDQRRIEELEEALRLRHKQPVNTIPRMTAGEQVVIDTEPDDLAHGPEVPPHRFSFFYKGETYAYAKGLEINPTHLPTALDAMALDGWHLCAIFGQTDSKNVGFIFERREPSYSGLELAHGIGWPDAPLPDREGPKYKRFMSGEPLDSIRDEGDGPQGRGRGLEP